MEWLRRPGRLPDDVAARMAARFERAVEPVRTCAMVDVDLCSRCHARGVPTRGQLFELERIRARCGAVVVRVVRGVIVVRLGVGESSREHEITPLLPAPGSRGVRLLPPDAETKTAGALRQPAVGTPPPALTEEGARC